MPQTVRTLLMAVAATPMIFFVAAAAQAEPNAEKVLRAKDIKRGINTVVLPLLTVDKKAYEGRDYKKTTIFQMDTKLTEDSDVLVRISAKQKKLFYIEFRF